MAQIRRNLDRAVRRIIIVVMDVTDDIPGVVEQCPGDFPSDALAGAGHNGGACFGHGSSLLRFTGNDNRSGMPETRPPIDLQGLSFADLQTLIDQRRLPPVDQWDPERCGHSRMRIGRDGTWFHDGAPIRRPAMVRLFATVLRREPDGRHLLVTPVEKLEIDVEATAFRAIEMTSEGHGRGRRIAFKLEIAVEEGHRPPGVWSEGTFFPLGATDEPG